jgi:hypothetical protein
VWTALRTDASTRRRTLVGLASFLAIEGAVFIRYTDVVELLVAVLAVLVFQRAMRVTWRTVALWLGSVVLFGAFVLAFNTWAYGHATSTGYSAGEITFSLSAFWPNLKLMPGQLLSAVPVYLVAAVATIAIVARALWARRGDAVVRLGVRRDLAVGAVLAVGWRGMWLLYFTYTWTAGMSGGGGGGGGGGGATVHLIRFYLPALGLLVLLATWALTRVHRALGWSVVGVLVIAALLSFYSMAGGGAAGAGGFPGGGNFPGGVGQSHVPPTGGYGRPSGARSHTPPGGGYGRPGGAPPSGGGPPGGN